MGIWFVGILGGFRGPSFFACADPPRGGGSGWVGTHSNPHFGYPHPPGVGKKKSAGEHAVRFWGLETTQDPSKACLGTKHLPKI